ncbi:serine protease snake-like [Zootermopsis nevadensis]|uniref:serine protease snake-like n=1 Tax=Zootermopsis nevadensis TaxID=136037 RepID=UPI000B8EE318|nr:serine protease snake-like [Zootermopsis nevadensis]
MNVHMALRVVKFRYAVLGHACITMVLTASGDISKTMCDKYSETVSQEEDSPVLTPGAGTNKVSTCGIVEVPLVVGGTNAAPREFPHMAIIGYGSSEREISWMCGGTLVSDEWVLTAAHCSKSRDKGPAKWVRLGELNLEENDEDSKPKDFNIVEIIPHPDYKPPSKYHDIALFKLREKVVFDAYIRPACLQVEKDFKDTKGIAIGYGRMDYASDAQSKELMKVILDFVTNDDCSTYYKNDVGGKQIPKGLIDAQMCSGVLEGGKDTCQGDSGGPLQVVLDNPYCMYSVVGVTSFGKFCGFKNSPAVYTRVSSYVPWIESVVWK